MVDSRNVTTRTPRPASLKQLPGLDVSASYRSSRVGGDFFDAVILDSRVVLLLTDIAGKRPEAHPGAAALQDVFRASSEEIFTAPDVNESEGIAALLHEVNRTLLNGSDGVRFELTFLGCYNLEFAILTYVNAGGVPPLFHDSDGTRVLHGSGVPLGLFSHLTHEPGMQAFEPGARMLLLTKSFIGVPSENGQ